MPKPPTIADLHWRADLVFHADSGGRVMIVDGDGVAGPSPVQALAISLAGCMSADIVAILAKGRHALRALRAQFVGERAQENPHRIVRMTLQFTIDTSAPDDAISRAIELSREKYCSVWHSMRQDIDFTTAYEISA
jgi:putative redox protein